MESRQALGRSAQPPPLQWGRSKPSFSHVARSSFSKSVSPHFPFFITKCFFYNSCSVFPSNVWSLQSTSPSPVAPAPKLCASVCSLNLTHNDITINRSGEGDDTDGRLHNNRGRSARRQGTNMSRIAARAPDLTRRSIPSADNRYQFRLHGEMVLQPRYNPEKGGGHRRR